MKQCRLVDIAGFMTRVEDEHRQILEAVKRSREVAAYYQEADAKKSEALRFLKGELIHQHQAELYRSNEGRFATLRRQIYECFRDHIFPSWDPDEEPNGVYWRDAFSNAQTHAWAHNGLDGATYRRRLNELADSRVTNPRLLRWVRPGYYVLAVVEGVSK